MNVLYKYCDQLGIVKILGSLELKLPCISEVNDPLECLPFFYCPNDKAAIEARYLSALNRKNRLSPVDYKQKLNERFEKGEIQKILEENARESLSDWNRKSCLLSVSGTAQEMVMWSHYTETHKGAVIGIDFDNISPDTNGPLGILMNPVSYSKDRPKMNVLSEEEYKEILRKTVLTKSIGWSYEEEFRTIFSFDYLKGLQQQGLANLKDFNGKKTWFLRLNPESIREVIFGLYTEESLKLAISKLIERPELQHVKLYQTEESETYTLNLVDIKSKIQ